jgi:murein DD-endopeptidase MepM/ murein hydrolase activator NlpD
MTFYYLLFHYDSAATRSLRAHNTRLADQIAYLESEMASITQDVAELRGKDHEVYRALLKADPLQPSDEATSAAAADRRFENLTLAETKERLDAIDQKLQKQKQSFRRLMGMLMGKESELPYMPCIRPVENDVVSGFGYRLHPILKVRKLHTGIDFSAPVGTPVYATANGKVKLSGSGGNGYGLQVEIQHGYGWETKYAHLSKILVPEGKSVSRGDLIGMSGSTGLCKGPHLHYEVKKNGKKIDPVDFFFSDLSAEAYIDFKRQAGQYNESMD